MYAQKLAKEMADARGRALYYIATMIPTDEEDHKRIENILMTAVAGVLRHWSRA